MHRGRDGSGGAAGSVLASRVRLDTEVKIVRALARWGEIYHPRSSSLVVLGSLRLGALAEPFRPGSLHLMEEREALRRLLLCLEEREILLLWLWHYVGMEVAQIARRLGVSRQHCYRMRRRAVEKMLRVARGETDGPGAEPAEEKEPQVAGAGAGPPSPASSGAPSLRRVWGRPRGNRVGGLRGYPRAC